MMLKCVHIAICHKNNRNPKWSKRSPNSAPDNPYKAKINCQKTAYLANSKFGIYICFKYKYIFFNLYCLSLSDSGRVLINFSGLRCDKHNLM